MQEPAELLKIPVTSTYMGKGTMAEDHPMCLGLHGRPSANEYVLMADFALAPGTRLTNVGTAARCIPDKTTHLVHVDIEPTRIGRTYAVRQALPGDIRAILPSKLDMVRSRGLATGRTSARKEVSALTARWRRERGTGSDVARDDNTAPVHPIQVIRALRNTRNDEDVLVCDSGFNQIRGGRYFEVRKPGRAYMGPRGFALPAAISHALANTDCRTVALVGDGGFAMVIHELETALRTGAPITACIINNSNLQTIKENQRVLHGERYLSTDLSDTGYAAIARALGCLGIRVERSGDLEGALVEAMASNRPAVADVCVIDDVVPDRIHLARLK